MLKLLQSLFPHTCVLCHDKTNRAIDICERCEKDLPFIKNACVYCAQPLPKNAKVCGQCLRKKPKINHTFALFEYRDAISKLIYDLKFQHQLVNAKVLSQLMIKYLKIKQRPDCIIPVPLHVKRLRERGFNQARELVRPIAKHFKIPLDISSCRRIKHTQAQAMISVKERKKNMKNAFEIDKNFKAKHVVIFDDVITTGQTVSELARHLKKHGISHIDVWCCAKTENLFRT